MEDERAYWRRRAQKLSLKMAQHEVRKESPLHICAVKERSVAISSAKARVLCASPLRYRGYAKVARSSWHSVSQLLHSPK